MLTENEKIILLARIQKDENFPRIMFFVTTIVITVSLSKTCSLATLASIVISLSTTVAV